MAGYSYFPTPYQSSYSQYQPISVPTPAYQQSTNSGIQWVQGEAAAKSYLVGAGQSAMLMDSDAPVFYIKSADASGMPLPLRVFDYQERVQAKADHSPLQHSTPEVDTSLFVTRDEFEKRLAELKKAPETARKVKASE